MRSPFAHGRMKPLFLQGPSSTLQLLSLVLLSVVMMTVDHRQHHLDALRAGLSLVVYPVQYLVNLPSSMGKWLAEDLPDRRALLKSNAYLREQNLLLKAQLQKFAALESENRRLRELLQSSLKVGERMLIAELLDVDMDPFKHQITLNKGFLHGVQMGQPLLDADGIVGQIVHAGPLTSTALLITDPSHALPVQINRSGLRALAVGTGSFNRLDIPYIPQTADIRVGDLLVTSGLGGRFPPDYPVAKIVSIEHNPSQPFARISAEPIAHLERSREVLLLQPDKAPSPPAQLAQPPTARDTALRQPQAASASSSARP